MILSNFDAGFEPLSAKHAALSARAEAIIDAYVDGTLDHPSYAVIGTFGAGKTQFLFSVVKEALRQGLLPMYFLAEDLFAEIIKSDAAYTQGDLDDIVMKRIGRASKLLSAVTRRNGLAILAACQATSGFGPIPTWAIKPKERHWAKSSRAHHS